jgi:hypothetical protein
MMSYHNIMETPGGVRRVGVIRKQTYITEDQDRAIKRLAGASGRSEADLIREAISSYLAAHGLDDPADPYLDLVALGSSGTEDGSIHHDAIYDTL